MCEFPEPAASFTNRTTSLLYRGVELHVSEDSAGNVWYEWDWRGCLYRHNRLTSAMSFMDSIVFEEGQSHG